MSRPAPALCEGQRACHRLGHDAVLIDADDHSDRRMRMARIDDLVVADQPADEIGPRAVNVYMSEPGTRFRIDPPRMLYSLQWLYEADGSEPPEFDLRFVAGDPKSWCDMVTRTLLDALAAHDPAVRDALGAAVAGADHSRVTRKRRHPSAANLTKLLPSGRCRPRRDSGPARAAIELDRGPPR